jgi:hypothetical protein
MAPALTIGLDKNGKIVEVRVNGEQVRLKRVRGRVCTDATKTLIYRLNFCPVPKKPNDPKPPKTSDPCCIIDPNGNLICWPPCVDE